MHEPLLDRIAKLERANRRWKTVALVLGITLAVVSATGGTFLAVLGSRLAFENGRAAQALEEAVRAEAQARAQVELARAQAERALQDARRKADGNP